MEEFEEDCCNFRPKTTILEPAVSDRPLEGLEDAVVKSVLSSKAVSYLPFPAGSWPKFFMFGFKVIIFQTIRSSNN